MNINYKIIEHERLGDAPFVGALVSAVNCNFNCECCFNQKIKNTPTIVKKDIDIINEIKSNIFNKGVIFAGLEWTLQLQELVSIASLARDNSLITMLYTGNTISKLKEILGCNMSLFDYVKCGKFDKNLTTINHIEYGVTLATSNQHIYKKGVDY